ncbi:hypothetical protein THAOC_02944, partial [Thalassiosira oceanica]
HSERDKRGRPRQGGVRVGTGVDTKGGGHPGTTVAIFSAAMLAGGTGSLTTTSSGLSGPVYLANRDCRAGEEAGGDHVGRGRSRRDGGGRRGGDEEGNDEVIAGAAESRRVLQSATEVINETDSGQLGDGTDPSVTAVAMSRGKHSTISNGPSEPPKRTPPPSANLSIELGSNRFRQRSRLVYGRAVDSVLSRHDTTGDGVGSEHAADGRVFEEGEDEVIEEAAEEEESPAVDNGEVP